MAVRSYRDLLVWQKAMKLAVEVYHLTDLLPERERFGLIVQARRASTSIPTDIAQGQGQGITAEYLRHLRKARGTVQELETLLLLMVELSYCTTEVVDPKLASCAEVTRMLAGLERSLAQGANP